MLGFLQKPAIEYNIIDTLGVLMLLFLAIVAFYGIKIAILIIKLKLKNRRKDNE